MPLELLRHEQGSVSVTSGIAEQLTICLGDKAEVIIRLWVGIQRNYSTGRFSCHSYFNTYPGLAVVSSLFEMHIHFHADAKWLYSAFHSRPRWISQVLIGLTAGCIQMFLRSCHQLKGTVEYDFAFAGRNSLKLVREIIFPR